MELSTLTWKANADAPAADAPIVCPSSNWLITSLSNLRGWWMQEVDVSADCLDILTRVLVAQPSSRMSMEQIKTHPWFLKGLPPGALEMNDFLLQGLANQEEVRRLPCQHSCELFQQALYSACKDSLHEPGNLSQGPEQASGLDAETRCSADLVPPESHRDLLLADRAMRRRCRA